MPYAERTTISAEKSRAEIERLLVRHGAQEFICGWQQGKAAILAFTINSRRAKVTIPAPHPKDFESTPSGRSRKKAAVNLAYDQEVRRLWRATLLILKAKFEAIESGITSFEEEFLSRLMLPGGRTVGEEIIPQIDRVDRTGNVQLFLPS